MSALDDDRVANGEPVYDPAAGTGAADLADGPATYDPAAPLPEVSSRSRRSGGRTNGSRRSASSRGVGGNGRGSTRGKKAERRSRDPLEETFRPSPDDGGPVDASVVDAPEDSADRAADPESGRNAVSTVVTPVDLLGDPLPTSAPPDDRSEARPSLVEDHAAEDSSLHDAGPPVAVPPAPAASSSLAPDVTPEPVLEDPPAGSLRENTAERIPGESPAQPVQQETPEPVIEEMAEPPAPPAPPEAVVVDPPFEPLRSGSDDGMDDPEAGQGWSDGIESPPESVAAPVTFAAPGAAPTAEPAAFGDAAATGSSAAPVAQLWGSDVTVAVAAPPVLSPPLLSPPAAGADVAPVSAVPADALAGDATVAETGGRIRRRRMIRSRKVRRVIRHVDPWSVLTFSVIFHLCLFSALLLAGALVWSAAAASGTIENIESFVRDLGDYDTWEIQGDAVLRAGVIIAGMMTLASTVLVVLLTVVFNLISDLIGGIRVTVIEEEVHRVPVPRRK